MNQEKMSDQFESFTPQVPILDIHEQAGMLSDFTAESLVLLMEAKNAILTLETVPNDLEALNNAFKVFYTIKGLAGFLNLHDIHRIAKDVEDFFDLWRKGLISFDEKIIEVSLEAVDTLRGLLNLLNEQISNNGSLTSPYNNIHPFLQKIYNIKRNIQIDDKIEDKTKRKILPISVEDSRSKMIKRQQELIQERELAIKLSQQAQREAAEKGQMLASMSHEMRTLINAILGFSDLLIKSPLEDKQKQFLSSIRSSGQLLLEIINNILDLAKIERGKIKFEEVPFDLLVLTEDVFRIIRTRLEGKPIDLYFLIDPFVPMGLKGDPTRLRQILINLLNNAVKFTTKGEVGLKITVQGDDRSNEVTLIFRVSDTGTGIPKSRQELIFEPFTQGDKSIFREYGGTGLGLTISRSYIESMGGKIWLESEVGKGSDFIFSMTFPKDTLAKAARHYVLSEKPLNTISVGLVDPDPRGALRAFCEKHQLSVIDFMGTPKEILNHFVQISNERHSYPQIIFIDTVSSIDDRHVLASLIRQDSRFRDTKLIAISSDIQINEHDQKYSQYFNDFLLKPVIEDEFISVVQTALDLRGDLSTALENEGASDLPCQGINVLIVDDSLTNLELIKAFFESIGCAGDYAKNGQEAIEMVKKNKYDICFMDLQMPVMNGYLAAQSIREDLKSDLPIVALTAADISEDKERCLKIGFNDFLTKPFDMQEFQDKIIHYGRK